MISKKMFGFNVFSIILLIFSIDLIKSEPNNVCKTYYDYLFINSSPNCWYNPDVVGDVYTILKLHNYPFKTYNITTKDGYILTLFRMIQKNPKKVVILEHPMTGNAANYMKSGNASLAFILYDAGYEVWLPNCRGTFYSKMHLNYSQYDYNYWDFSFHELATIDIPAQVEFISNITKRNDIIYIGYSMAGTTAAIYGSLLPQHAEKHIKLFIVIGATIYLDNQIRQLFKLDMNQIMKVNKLFGVGTLFPTFERSITNIYLICNSHPFKFICIYYSTFVAGGTWRNFDPALVPVLLNYLPARIPWKYISHFDQIKLAQRFQFYDYGLKENMKHYNSETPPLYPLENISIPFYLIYGEYDTWVTVKDNERVYSELNEKARVYGKYEIPSYNHLDFLYSKDSREKLGEPIVKLIEKIK